MSEPIPELGEIAYVGYFKASDGKSLVSGAPLPAWDEQSPDIRRSWNLAAMAVVDRWREAGDEPAEPDSILVVQRDGHPDRRFRAAGWGVNEGGSQHGDLELTEEDGASVVQIGSRCWDSVYSAHTVVPDEPDHRALLVRAVRELADSGSPGQNRLAAELARDGGIEL